MKTNSVLAILNKVSKFSFYMLLALSLAFTMDCSKKKKKAMFWMAALTGGGTTSTGTGTNYNPNGDPLPPTSTNANTGDVAVSGNGTDASANGTGTGSSTGTDTNTSTGTNTNVVATSGHAIINGRIEAFSGDVKDTEYTDYSGVTLQLLDPDGNVIQEIHANGDGTFSFDIANLGNNNYQVYIPKGNGLSSTYENFNFTYNPSDSTKNTITLADLNPQVYTYTTGAAQIVGTASTQGYKDALGNLVLGAQQLPNGTPVKIYAEDSNGSITLPGFDGKTYSLISTSALDGSGNYAFNFTTPETYLTNGGRYVVQIEGSNDLAKIEGRPFIDSYVGFTFYYTASKTDNAVVTVKDLGNTNLQWNAASSSPATISGSVVNSAFPSGDQSGYTVIIKDSNGGIIDSTTTGNDGNYSFTKTLSNGNYSIEVSKDNFNTVTSGFNYVANPNGTSSQTISIPTIGILAKEAKVTGQIKVNAGDPTNISGAVISFRPAPTVASTDLDFILTSPYSYQDFKNMVMKWKQEMATYGVYKSYSTKTYELEYNCSDNSKTIVVEAGNAAGPAKLGCATGTTPTTATGNLIMPALPGTWQYFVSAAGYSPSPTGIQVFNGIDLNIPLITLTPNAKRSIIAGTATVLDTLTDGTKNAYGVAAAAYSAAGYGVNSGLAGMIGVLLNSKNNSGQSVAHLTLTKDNGEYKFDNIHVVLPSNLTDDSQRVAYAVGEYAKFLAGQPSAVVTDPSSIVSTNTADSNAGLFSDGTNYYFKTGTYNAFIVDPKQHMSNSSTTIDNSSVEGTPGADLTSANTTNAVTTVAHLPRRNITGTVSDAISTSGISGATVQLCKSVSTATPPVCEQVRMDTAPKITDLAYSPYMGRAYPIADIVVPDATTGADGSYTISNIDPGNYVLLISKNGYVTGTINVTVPTNGAGLTNGNTVSNVNPQIVIKGPKGDLTGLVKLVNSNGTLTNFTGAYSLELTHPIYGTRPVGTNPAGLSGGAVTYTTPTYNAYSINPGQWKLKFVAGGYKTVEGLVTIQSNATTTFDIITMIPETQLPADISGKVTSAMLAGQPVSGLTVTIRAGVNIKDGSVALDANGQPIASVTTSATGAYVIPNVPAGNYTIEVGGTGNFGPGFGNTQAATTYLVVISAGTSTPASQNVLISPVIGSDEVRIVLSWNASPKDLDSHLEYKNKADATVAGERQAAYGSRNPGGSVTVGDITLDVDVVSGYGPETVTLKGTAWNQTRRGYSIFNYTSKYGGTFTSIADSGAIIRVFKSQGLVKTYQASTSQSGVWWQLFCLKPDKSIIDVGNTGCMASDFFNQVKN